jgi:predicted component of type VI protein secretion system
LGSMNGTFINGRELISGESYPIRCGDNVTIGTVNYRVSLVWS